MVTAEFAVVLPAIVIALVAGLIAIALFTMRLRCADAAQVAARLAARGESTAVAVAAARRAAPADADISIRTVRGEVSVFVQAELRVRILGGLLSGFAVGSSFSEAVEPGPPP